MRLDNVDFGISFIERHGYKNLASLDEESPGSIRKNPNHAIPGNKSQKKKIETSNSLSAWDIPFTENSKKPWQLYNAKPSFAVSGKKKEVSQERKTKEQQKGPKGPKKTNDVNDQSATGRKQSNKFRVKNRQLLKDLNLDTSDDKYKPNSDEENNKETQNSKRESNPQSNFHDPNSEPKSLNLSNSKDEERQQQGNGEKVKKTPLNFNFEKIVNNKVELTQLVFELLCRPNWERQNTINYSVTCEGGSNGSVVEDRVEVENRKDGRVGLTDKLLTYYGQRFQTFLETINKILSRRNQELSNFYFPYNQSGSAESLMMEFLALVQLYKLLILYHKANAAFTSMQNTGK